MNFFKKPDDLFSKGRNAKIRGYGGPHKLRGILRLRVEFVPARLQIQRGVERHEEDPRGLLRSGGQGRRQAQQLLPVTGEDLLAAAQGAAHRLQEQLCGHLDQGQDLSSEAQLREGGPEKLLGQFAIRVGLYPFSQFFSPLD